MNDELNPLIASSADPTKVALTIKGILTALIPIGIYLAKQHGLDITADAAGKAIADFLEAATALLSAGMVVFGLIRKLYYWLARRSA